MIDTQNMKLKHKYFFRNLIVLARETIFAYKNNLEQPKYIIYEHESKDKWHYFTYDIYLKKWKVESIYNPKPEIFNPRVITGLNKYLEYFTLEDIEASSDLLKTNYPDLRF